MYTDGHHVLLFDGAHKLKDCARAQMQGCVFRGLLAQGTTFMLACRM
jgi:hypothetical protein